MWRWLPDANHQLQLVESGRAVVRRIDQQEKSAVGRSVAWMIFRGPSKNSLAAWNEKPKFRPGGHRRIHRRETITLPTGPGKDLPGSTLPRKRKAKKSLRNQLLLNPGSGIC